MTSLPTSRPNRRLLIPVSLASAGLLVLTGCGGAADDAVAATATTEQADGPTTVEVELVDFDFVGLPDSINAGTALTVTNTAERELHELVAFRLADDDERSVEELTRLSPVELVEALGEPRTVILAEPGGDAIFAVGDGTLDEPGRYALMCFIPTGVEPAVYLQAAAETEEGPPQVDGGPPHFVHGMYAQVTVD